jgi:serine phosphatase RsbU (regulator of sigma subunit)
MSSPTLAFLKSIDPAVEAERFFYEVCRKLVLLSQAERIELIEWSAKAKEVSDLNLAGHTFAEAMLSIYAADFPKVISNLSIAADTFRKIGHKGGQMATAAIYCTYYRTIGQLDKAHEYIQDALKFVPEVPIHDIYGYFNAVSHYQAAEISVEMKNYDAALEHYNEGLPFSEENVELKGRLLNGLGVLFMNQEKWKESIEYLERSLGTIVSQKNIVLESKIHADIGMYYFRTKDFARSMEQLEKSLKMRLDNGMHNPAITNYIRLTELCLASGDLERAKMYGHLAVENSEKLKVNMKLYEAHQALAAVYDQLGDTANAYYHFKSYHKHKEEVHNQEVIRKVEQLKNQHKVESARIEKEIVHLRNVELKAAMSEITESFRYAKRIQAAILPPGKFVNEVFRDSFVLFKPKDIVSGDFYWMEIIESTNTNQDASRKTRGLDSYILSPGTKVLIAAVDCTGHGVPGAMVSMVGHNCLNKAVHEFGLSRPAEILNKLTELVEGTFIHKDFHYTEDEIKDGMDISICLFDKEKQQVEWAGANNPLWMMRNGAMMEFKADKQPIGKFDNRQPFTNHVIDIQPGDCFYLFTDGYADQFGGPSGKKFKYKQLSDLLCSMLEHPMNQQKIALDERFESWRGNLEQVDDICMIGIRL